MYRDYSFSEKDIDLFKALIPDCYMAPLKEGKLSGIVVMDDNFGESDVVGIVLCRETLGYIEIVWAATTKEYELEDYGADMVRRIVNKARVHGGYAGVYGVFRKGSPMENYFPQEEFVLSEETGGVYRFSLKDVDKVAEEDDNKRVHNCVPLSKADGTLKNKVIENAIEAHEAIPIAHPVRWDKYDQELSFVYQIGDDAEGVILVEHDDDDELVISLLYSRDPVATIVLLKHSFHVALGKYGEDCKIACPIVTKNSERLVKKLVHDPTHTQLIRATADLPIGTGTMIDYVHYTNHRKEHG